jgi:hypothetical protein
MSSADKNDNGMFDFFPDLLPDDDEQFDSEEEALDAILRKNTAEPEEEQLWQTPAAETEAPYIPADTSFPAEQPVQNDDMIPEEPVIAAIREEEAEAISPVVEAVPALVEEEAQEVSKPVSERMLRRMALGYLASKQLAVDGFYLSTAHAAKFGEVVERAAGVVPTLPKSLSEAVGRERRATPIEAKDDVLADFLLKM